MIFKLQWTTEATERYSALKAEAEATFASRQAKKKAKSSRVEGLFKQVHKALDLLRQNPRHPSLQTHEYHSLPHPHKKGEKVFEAYVQQDTPAAYRLFWCYGPDKGTITIISITAHP